MTESSLHGQCHCRNISFALRWTGEPAVLEARGCSCSFCSPRASSWASIPTATLELGVQSPRLVSRYRFASQTAEFHVCARCGAVPVATSLIDGHVYGTINVQALLGVEPGLVRHQTVDHGDETVGTRLERRKRRWIADVRYAGATRPLSFRTGRTVLFGDCDPGGVIYTPRVADFVVEAAMEFMSDRLCTPAARHALNTGIVPPARMLTIEYLAWMTYDDRLEIEVSVEHIGVRSYTLAVRGRKFDETLTFSARLVQVCVSTLTQRPVPLPPELRFKLEESYGAAVP